MGEAARRKKTGEYPAATAPAVVQQGAALGWPEFTDEARRALEGRDSFAVMRNRLRALGSAAHEYAGFPMGIDGEQLHVHPSYRFAEVFKPPVDPPDASGAKVRNVFWSKKYRVHCAVVQEADGRIWHAPLGVANHADKLIRTMGCSVAWGIEQESKALQLLGTLVRHVPFKYYLLTGMFMETSPRSGLTYVFRKLRPTIVLSPRAPKGGGMRIISALCMHPIGYYADSWAGAMCPTDDVIAHLMLCRGDEPRYWKECNQIPADRHEAGI